MTSNTVNLVNVQPGMRLKTKVGEEVEVIENPQDGIWLLCRHISAEGHVDALQEITAVFAQDIEGIA